MWLLPNYAPPLFCGDKDYGPKLLDPFNYS